MPCCQYLTVFYAVLRRGTCIKILVQFCRQMGSTGLCFGARFLIYVSSIIAYESTNLPRTLALFSTLSRNSIFAIADADSPTPINSA